MRDWAVRLGLLLGLLTIGLPGQAREQETRERIQLKGMVAASPLTELALGRRDEIVTRFLGLDLDNRDMKVAGERVNRQLGALQFAELVADELASHLQAEDVAYLKGVFESKAWKRWMSMTGPGRDTHRLAVMGAWGKLVRSEFLRAHGEVLLESRGEGRGGKERQNREAR